MTIGAKPPAEVTIDSSLVRALLSEHHADLAHLPLNDLGEGWDNRLFRLGDELIVRMPRRAASAALIEHEQQWLPRLSPSLPLPIPVPLRVGRPGCGFPWPWSVVPWFPGQTALVEPVQDIAAAATSLGQFLRGLHQPAPGDAPHNPWRSNPLAARTGVLREHLQQVDGLVDRVAVLALWERVLSTRPYAGPPSWIHGDLHPGNLLLSGGRLAAVLDFGDLAAGDPATDLSVAWMWLPLSARSTFRAAARGTFDPLDDDTWMRARGWALALGLVYLANSRDDELMRALGRATIDAALNDNF
jgi:aminoglycoside phosphotransferase (APT) family kinase protein